MRNTQYQIIWDNIEHTEWDRLLESVRMPNLLQSWAYGDAKADVEHWKVRRGLILHEGCAVGMFQALEKSYPIIGGIVRINRGPLWLHEPVSIEEVSGIYLLIRKQWSWWKRRILLIAPELQESQENRNMLILLGYRKRRKNAWCSGWLNLRKEKNELRKKLKRKWRNMLSSAEKANLRFQVSFSDKDFQWLMHYYRELMLKKGFQGPSIKLLSSMREHLYNKEDMLVMQAMSEDKPVAGILVCRHGLACTYLIGWNSPEGRILKAHNFLLWYATIEMKLRGCWWFDLGGISDTKTPEIAIFKRGMGGEEYQLVGEWW